MNPASDTQLYLLHLRVEYSLLVERRCEVDAGSS